MEGRHQCIPHAGVRPVEHRRPYGPRNRFRSGLGARVSACRPAAASAAAAASMSPCCAPETAGVSVKPSASRENSSKMPWSRQDRLRLDRLRRPGDSVEKEMRQIIWKVTAKAEDTFQILTTRDSSGPRSARLMSTHLFEG
jgi:hypothetical protein